MSQLLDYRARIVQLVDSRQHLRNDPPPQSRYNSYHSNAGASALHGGPQGGSLLNRIGGYQAGSGSSYRSRDERDDRRHHSQYNARSYGTDSYQPSQHSDGYSGGYSRYGRR